MIQEDKFYVAETVEDELGSGFRLFSHDDDVYESRTTGEHHSRLYGNDGNWQAKVHLPLSDNAEAFEAYKELAELITDEYDVDLYQSAHDFNRQLRYSDHAERSEDNTFLQYTKRDKEVPGQSSLETLTFHGTLFGGYFGVGAIAGGALGTIAGPPGAATGAVGGALLGAIGGGVGGLADIVGNAAITSRYDTDTVGGEKPYTPTRFVTHVVGKRHRNKYAQGKGLKPRRLRGQPKLLEKLNRLNHADRVIRETDQLDLEEEYNALKDADIEKVFNTVTAFHFEGAENARGLHAGRQFDEYADAADFIGLLQENEAVDIERPTMYEKPEVFQQIFSYLVYEHDGKEHILPAGEELIGNVFDEDADPAIDEFLQTEYGTFYDEAGIGELP